MRRNSLPTLIGFAMISTIVMPITAHAYIDAGTGSQVIQLAIASVVGSIFLVKTFYRNIRAFLTNLSHKKQK